MKTEMLILLAGTVALAMGAPQFDFSNEQPMPYNFAYGVNSGGTGDQKEHKESVSPSGVLEGEYRWLQPNGLYRVTRYSADSVSGYRAVVSEEPGEEISNYYRNSQNEKGLTAGSFSSQQSFSNLQSGNQAFSRPQNFQNQGFSNFQSNEGTRFSTSGGFQNQNFNRGQGFQNQASNQGQSFQSQAFTSPQNFQGQSFSTTLTLPSQNFAFSSQLQGNVIDGGIIDGGIIDGGIIDGGIIDGGFSNNDSNRFGSNFNQFSSTSNRFTTGSNGNSFSSSANNFGSNFNSLNNAGFQGTGRNQGVAVVLSRNVNRFSG